MKQTVGFSQFCDAFPDTYKNNFTYVGRRALFDYIEQLELVLAVLWIMARTGRGSI